jgi:hypothetical protein
MASDIHTNEMYQGVDLCLEDQRGKKSRHQQMRDAGLYGYRLTLAKVSDDGINNGIRSSSSFCLRPGLGVGGGIR